MTYILTKSPHQKIDKNYISSQWEGTHIRFTENKNNLNSVIPEVTLNVANQHDIDRSRRLSVAALAMAAACVVLERMRLLGP